MATQPEPNATITLTAELLAGVWTVYGQPSQGARVALGAGPVGTGIMFPARALERLMSDPS